MAPSNRPDNAAPGGMGGATRMYDPSEARHDRIRRRLMNVAFLVIALLNVAQWRLIGLHGGDRWSVLLLMAAAVPSGIAVKVFELRIKMSRDERKRVLRELPARTRAAFTLYACFAIAVGALNAPRLTWALFGVWLYDFVTYYHDRPERIRHLYAVTKTLDEIRQFRAPWAWTLPALAWEVVKRLNW